ncbi:MAG: TonB-dependent receptor plug domain-containing protein [Burkholderiales bacterium]|nr:TonB-dependent receptor plug domain-containing protein [Burkholderiales bacterium]
MKTFHPHAIALALMALTSVAQAQQSTTIDKITVTGEGDKLGAGLMVDEDAPKARSTVTKAVIDKQRPGSNPYQALTYLPGVNANSQDATGLFGGNLRVRGFNSDQMGFTINGAPVNDSGNFAVYPMEYTDSENLCEMFITQGATDTEAPHVGASGGNVGMNTCAPKDKMGGRVAVSLGQLNFHRFFLRGDTGKLGDFKGFLSYSNSQVDKWKGSGKADRNHIDAGAEYKLGNTTFNASLLYNRAVNNNIGSMNPGTLANLGYYADFAATPPQHATPWPAPPTRTPTPAPPTSATRSTPSRTTCSPAAPMCRSTRKCAWMWSPTSGTATAPAACSRPRWPRAAAAPA